MTERKVHLNERKEVQKRFDEASASVTYVGEARAGLLDSEVGWRIYKFETVSTITTKKWAQGTLDYDKVWDDRASYSYS